MQQKIFAINAGSSSLKFQLLNMPSEHVLAKGIFEEIGSEHSCFKLHYQDNKLEEQQYFKTHKECVAHLLDALINQNIIQSLEEIVGVGHRVAHGGEFFKQSAIIDEEAIKEIDRLSALAPSHNPINLMGIQAFQEVLSNALQVAVFDTAYHQTLDKTYYMYPLPYPYYEKYGIRKYGFHGTSHHYIAQTVVKELEKIGQNTLSNKIISCHLGNGASICAIKNGKSVNTSMGFTPLAGLMMGSRSGDIDPTILTFLSEKENYTGKQLEDILNKQSGLLGISGISNDLRKILSGIAENNEQCELALDMFVNRIAQTIASYMVDLQGVEVIVFTAGIGENSAEIRKRVINKLAYLGICLDHRANVSNQLFIHDKKSSVKVAVIPTNEEVMIARDVVRLLGTDR